MSTDYLPSGQIFVGNSSNQIAPVSLSGDATLSNIGALTIANNAVNLAKLEVSARPVSTVLINGGFSFAQRQTPATYTNVADAAYGPDQWKMLRENAAVQYARQDGIGQSGILSPYYGNIKKITADGKVAFYQIIESANAYRLRTRQVTFQIKMKTDSTRTIRMAIVEQTGATADTVANLFSSLSSAANIDPTIGANLSALPVSSVYSSDNNASIVSSSTPGLTAASCTVGTNWKNYAISCTVGNSSQNLICAIWTDDNLTASTGIISVAEAGLYDGGSIRDWLPRPIGEELALCQRYYEKSCPPDIVLGIDGSGGYQMTARTGSGATAIVNGDHITYVPFKVTKFKTPTVVVYGYGAIANTVSEIANGGDLANNSGSVYAAAPSGFDIYNNSGGSITPSAGGILFQYTAAAEL
jgi:hypothetical protein